MPVTIVLHKLRQNVDRKYVGFIPQNTSVKPVHIANGLFKIMSGKAYDNRGISKLSYVYNAKGITPKGNDDENVRKYLIDNEKVIGDISIEDLKTFRVLLQDLLNSDSGVFGVDKMIAFSAPSKYFVTTDVLYQDAGEFVGGMISSVSVKLKTCVRDALDNKNDPISLLFLPVLGDEEGKKRYEDYKHEELVGYVNHKYDAFMEVLKISADCLAENINRNTNKLSCLREANFFAIITLLRYVANLEQFYADGLNRPMLIDCIGDRTSPIARASEMCYTQMMQAISRCYAWFFAEELKLYPYSISDLLASNTPEYDENKTPKDKNAIMEIWDIAKLEASEATKDKDKYSIFATALFDILALEASSHPTKYFQSLGIKAGVFYPPANANPNKKIVFSTEMLEVLIKASVLPNETITMSELLKRLWTRFGIIVGGNAEDENRLQAAGIYQADEEALKLNRECFERTLKTMDLADIMADGILQVRLGGRK